MSILSNSVKRLVGRAISEDVSHDDVTTQSLIPGTSNCNCKIIVKDNGVLAGIGIAIEVFKQIDPDIRSEILVYDGAEINPGDVVANLQGRTESILKGERVALNFLQHASGIASETSKYVKAIRGSNARIVDTRKTTPGLREIEKYSVRVGGGYSHRFNLSDGILIKDNHIAALKKLNYTIENIISKARENAPHTLRIEIEVETIQEARDALNGKADIILLDNMSVEDMRKVVNLVDGNCLLEASGGITIETVKQVAETGVDLISIGSITHSVKSLDISLDFE